MKKLLIATAALAMVAGTAQAQSSVSVYGNIDVGYTTQDNDAKGETGKNTGNDAIAWSNDSSSRLGFRGTEDLGGGLKASFTLETGLSGIGATSGAATTLGSRAQWIELSSNSGSARLGFQDTGHRMIVNGYDAASATNAIGNLNQKDSVLAGRFNGVTLSTAVMSGFQAAVQVAKNTQSADGKDDVDASGYGLMARYSAGKFSAAASYAVMDSDTPAVAASTTAPTTVTISSVAYPTSLVTAAADATQVETKVTAVGASYDLGVAKLMAVYGKVEAKDAKSTTGVSKTTSERDFTQVGVQVPMGKTTAFAQYTTGETQTGTGSAVGYKGDATGYTVGARYALSKRTYVYGIYGADEVDTAADKSTKRDQITFGMNHAF
jgi:predicted porin